MKRNIRVLFLGLTIVCVLVVSKASAFTPGNGKSAPIDGGLSLLLAAGIGLGVKKVFSKNKELDQTEADPTE